LADGFRDDPLMSAIWPDPTRRHCALPGYFAASLTHFHIPAGGVQVAIEDGQIGAVAVWDPPGTWDIGLPAIARAVPDLIGPLGVRTPAALKVLHKLDSVHPRQPHWYLANFASSSERRGTGLARELLRTQLAHCDQEDQAAYLVATLESNVGYYGRFGFDITRTFTLPGNGAKMWAMWRTQNTQSDWTS
jgi:ribosomal protein S18 acetylase RimI-like enzyme